jgi:TP901 family phage tail tape measure protein
VNNEFKLAMQLTMVDMLSGAAQVAKRNILAMGAAGKEVARDFDLMTAHITRGLKAVAVANYSINKLKPGVAAAADMQEATLDVKMNLMESGQNAGELARQLATVRATAVDIQKQMPFGAQEVMGIENVLLKAGLGMGDVTAKGGAAWAAAALATISKEAPQAMGEGLIAMASPFNLKGGQFGEIADFLQRVDQASVTTIPELVEGMKYVSGTAANMKVSWKETLLAMGAMSQQGLKGSMAGTSLNDFLIRMVGTSRIERRVLAALNAELRGKGKAPLEFFDKGGRLKTLPAIIANLRTSLDGLTDQKRMFVLQKIFGEQGARAAFALIHQGAGSWEEVAAGAAKAADMQGKLNTRLEGFNANLKSLAGTSKTTAASIFNPWLEPLNAITKGANEAVAAVGKFADNHPKAADAANGIIAAGLATVAGYGVYNLAKGGIAGARVLKGLKGFGGSALGIAEGKAVQAATGVTPVFVTNWPSTFGGVGAVANAGGIAVGAARNYLPWLAGGATFAAAAGVPISMAISDAARQNGWASKTWSRSDREYEVMGIGGKKRDINLSLQIDGQGRVTSGSDDMGTRINTMKRGSFFGN